MHKSKGHWGLENPNKLAFTIEEATAAGAGSHSEIYLALKEGRLRAKKRGRRTIILRDELERFLLALPDYKAAIRQIGGGGGAWRDGGYQYEHAGRS